MIEVFFDPRLLEVGRDTDLTVRLANTGPDVCTDLVFRLDLPTGIVLLRGGEHIRAARLAPGQAETRTVRVCARRPGQYRVTSGNFSYRDSTGMSRRIRDFAAMLDAVEVAESAEPAVEGLAVSVANAVLPCGQDTVLRGRVDNVGGVDFISVRVETADAAVEQRGPECLVGPLAVAQSAPFALRVRLHEHGERVPIRIRTVGATRRGRELRTDHTATVAVSRPERPGPGPQSARPTAPPSPVVKILYLAANPEGTVNLRLDHELREIREAIELGSLREAIALESRTSIRLKDLTRALLQAKPTIVHFSGHGDEDGSYYVEDEVGDFRRLSPEGIAAIFEVAPREVTCVIANACHSELLVTALSAHVDHVIGMRRDIGDQAAIDFSIGFYQALSEGLGIATAYRHGRAYLANSGHMRADAIPVLLTRRGSASPGAVIDDRARSPRP